jgi:hypothetical protein
MSSNENELIFRKLEHDVSTEEGSRAPRRIDIARTYTEFRGRFFGDRVPELCGTFVCEFIKLPFDVAGICLLQDRVEPGIRPGIRINDVFRDFPAEAKVALLHEMVHAAGVRGHDAEFKLALLDLFTKNAYLDPLII